MRSDEFINKLLDIANNYKTVYIMGCFGAPMTAKNKTRYTANHAFNKTADRKARINACSTNTFGFDCVGLVKGVLWGWDGNVNRVYGGAGYKVNGVPDTDAKKMLNYCTDISTDFKNIQAGEFVWMDGHCGVYVGDGKVVESTPKWTDGVLISNMANLGYTSGHSRTWTKHGKLQWIEYAPSVITKTDATERKYYVVQKGDTLIGIGKKTGIAWRTIAKLNNIKIPYIIRVGQKLYLE